MRKVIKRSAAILFLLIATAFFTYEIQDLFFNFVGNEPLRLKSFYLEDANSLDMVVIGSSEINLGYSAPQVYKETSITSYPYSFSVNPVPLWKYELADIERYQSPSLIVIEINGAIYSEDKHIHSNGAFYKLVQSMPFSRNRLQLALDQSPSDDSIMSNIFPFIRYHGQWADAFDNTYFKDRLAAKKRGYSVLKGAETPLVDEIISYDNTYPFDDATEELNPDAEAALREFLEICKEAKTPNILFIQYPHLMVSDSGYARHKRYNRAGEIIKEYGFEYLDLSASAEAIGIDPENDFYDSEHLNGYGQKKISSYLGKLVKDKYDMQSKSLDNTQVSNWNLCADYIDSFYKYYEENRDPVRIEDGDNLPNLRESVKYMNILSNH